jgi:hypothetical protein
LIRAGRILSKSKQIKQNTQSEADRAEMWQSVKALLIPLSLFLACLIAAAGIFLVYKNEKVGIALIVVAAIVIVLDFIGLIRFQNKLRAKGMMPDKHDTPM